jgi:hypothetical protein
LGFYYELKIYLGANPECACFISQISCESHQSYVTAVTFIRVPYIIIDKGSILSTKIAGRDRTGGNTVRFYIPDTLHEVVKAFAKSSGAEVEKTYADLSSKGLHSKAAEEYRSLVLKRNHLERTALYAEYSKDNVVLGELVTELKNENAEMKQVLLSKGLLRKIPEKHRP